MITDNWKEYIFTRLEDMLDRVESLMKLVPANAEDEWWALDQLKVSLKVAKSEFDS